MNKPSNVVRLSFADRSPGSPDQISRIRACLHRNCVDRMGNDATLERLADEDDRDAALTMSMREDLDAFDRHGWLWIAASLGDEEAIAQIGIVAQVRALTASPSRADVLRRASDAWVALGRSVAAVEGHRVGGSDEELLRILAGDGEDDSFPVHPAANLYMD